jgi:hypothetical protein
MHRFAILMALIFSLNLAANELKLHVIKPNGPINWDNYISYVWTKGRNIFNGDDFPLGTFIAEVRCMEKHESGAGRFMISHKVINDDRKKSKIHFYHDTKEVSMYYNFKSKLHTYGEANNQVQAARREGRLKTLVIPTTAFRCWQMGEYVDDMLGSFAYTYEQRLRPFGRQERQAFPFTPAILYEIATGLKLPKDWYRPFYATQRIIQKQKESMTYKNYLQENPIKDDTFAYQMLDPLAAFDWIDSMPSPFDDQFFILAHLTYDSRDRYKAIMRDEYNRIVTELELKPHITHYMMRNSHYTSEGKYKRKYWAEISPIIFR